MPQYLGLAPPQPASAPDADEAAPFSDWVSSAASSSVTLVPPPLSEDTLLLGKPVYRGIIDLKECGEEKTAIVHRESDR